MSYQPDKYHDFGHRRRKDGSKKRKRLGPGGSSPAAGSESRGAATEPEAHKTNTPPLDHSEAEDGVKLQRLRDWILVEADRLKQIGGFYRIEDKHVCELFESSGRQLSKIGSELTSILSEPRTKSEVGGNEVCVCAIEEPGWENQDGIKCCFLCASKNSTLSERERSEPRNAEVERSNERK